MKKRLLALLVTLTLTLSLLPAAGAANVYDPDSGLFPEFDSAMGYYMTAVGGKEALDPKAVPKRNYAPSQEIDFDDCVDYLQEYIDLLESLGTFEVIDKLDPNSAGDRYTAMLRYTGNVETKGSLLAMRADRTWGDYGEYHMTLTAEYSEYRRAHLKSMVEIAWDSALTPVSTELRTPSGERLGQGEDSQTAQDNRLSVDAGEDADKPGDNWDGWDKPFGDAQEQTPGDVTVTAPEAPDTTVVLAIGYNKMCVNGEVGQVDSESENVYPVAENNRTLVPVSRIVDAFGGQSSWDSKTNNTTYTLGQRKVHHVIGSTRVDIRHANKSQVKNMETPSKALYNRTYVPVRYVLEGLGLWVGYEPTYKLVVVSTRNLAGQDLVDLSESQRLFASETIPEYPRAVFERYAVDGMGYSLEVGQALTLFNPHQTIGDYYAYSWDVVDGGELVSVDRDGPTCQFYAKRPGVVTVEAHLDETVVLSLGHYDNNSYTRTFTITIRPDSGSTTTGSLMNWQTCPTCGGSRTIRVGSQQRDCPTCGGRGSIFR